DQDADRNSKRETTHFEKRELCRTRQERLFTHADSFPSDCPALTHWHHQASVFEQRISELVEISTIIILIQAAIGAFFLRRTVVSGSAGTGIRLRVQGVWQG